MQILIAILGSGLLSAVVSGSVTLISKAMDKKSATTRVMLSITRDRIKSLCRGYIERGHITMDELEDLSEMHNAYHDAGGNGFCDDLMRRVKTLPIVNDLK